MEQKMANEEDFRRLESKVDRLTDAVMRLVLIEERQTTQGERIGAIEQRLAAHDVSIQNTDRRLDKWINRGTGAWGLAVVSYAAVELGIRWLR